jgi:site-specific DNA-methyltransferase (adenine-specific)
MKLTNGDCLEVMKQIPNESVDMVLTDPPYLCDYSRHDSKSRFSKKIANDENNSANEGMIEKYLQECYRIMKDNTAIYCFCNYKKIDFFKQQIETAGFNLKNIIIWDKQRNGMGDLSTTFGYSYEFIIFASKGQPKIRGKRISDVWQFARVKPKEQEHQNQKPVDLLVQAIEKSTDEGAVIFDGFMGVGSTGVACINTNRDFIGIELDQNYFNIAKKRIEEAKECQTQKH